MNPSADRFEFVRAPLAVSGLLATWSCLAATFKRKADDEACSTCCGGGVGCCVSLPAGVRHDGADPFRKQPRRRRARSVRGECRRFGPATADMGWERYLRATTCLVS